MLLGAHLAGLAFANAPVAGVHALAYPLGGLHHLPHGLSNALMLRHVLQHNAEAAREHYAELAPILAPECEGQGSQARCAMLIDRLDRLVARQRPRAAASRSWHRRGRHPDAGERGDEAAAAAGEQSLPDRAKPTPGGSTRRPGEPRRAARPRPTSRRGASIATRWADNDAYGHVNNTVFYQWFDSAVNAWLVEQGLLDIDARRSDRPGGRNALQLTSRR